MDDSHLDNKYFIDSYVYNCPFCKRGNVSYVLQGAPSSFDWSNEKKCYIYLVVCASCEKKSMHLSFDYIDYMRSGSYCHFCEEEGKNLDDKFFYSVPTSFFSLNKKIPKVLRELITEAEGCLKSNFLTGASACIRKIIYELANLQKVNGNSYDERIKALKGKRKDVDAEYFDTLLTIQQITSNKVHERSYDGWESKHIKLILSALIEILTLIYIIPETRKEKRQSLLELKKEILGGKKKQDKSGDVGKG